MDDQRKSFFPKDPVELTGRIPIKASNKFLADMRLNSKKELIALCFLCRKEADEGEKKAWDEMIEYHVGRE